MTDTNADTYKTITDDDSIEKTYPSIDQEYEDNLKSAQCSSDDKTLNSLQTFFVCFFKFFVASRGFLWFLRFSIGKLF